MFDVTGVIILIVLIGLFGFLTMRARQLKDALLKWISLFFSGLLTLTATALLILGGIGYYKLNQHYDNPIPDVQVVGTPEQIARGEKLASTCCERALPPPRARRAQRFATLFTPALLCEVFAYLASFAVETVFRNRN